MNRLLLMIFLFSFLNCFSNQEKPNHMIDYENCAYSLTNDAGEKINQKYGLVPIGTGGIVKENIKKLSLSLQSKDILSIDQARALIVGCVNEYLKVINNDSALRQYLETYPFTENNIELNLFIQRSSDLTNHFGKLIVVTSFKGKIYYDILKTEFQHETVLEESFEEAVRIVQECK